MKITVDVNNVKIDELNVFHKGEYNVNNLQFSFSSDYTDDLVSRAVFGINGELIYTAIINNQCIIPEKVLLHNGDVFLGVYAYNIQDGKLSLRYSPQPTKFYIFEGSYDNDISEPEEITPSQFDQYIKAMNDGLNKVEESLTKMDSATSSANDLVDDINQKLENGEFNGTNGKDGVGIASITSGQSIQQDGNTVTPVTVNKTDGTQQTFNVSAKNGIDGINGTDGNDGVTPNLQIGTVITLEPNEQATVTRTGTAEQPVFNFGIPKGQQGEQGIPGQDGQPGQDGADGKDATINGQNTVEITTDNNITLDQQESVLELGLNSQLIPKQDVEGTDNTFDDGLKSPLYDLGGDGKSEQVVSDGSNLLDINYSEFPKKSNDDLLNCVVNDDFSFTVTGNKSEGTFSNIDFNLNSNLIINQGTQYYINGVTLKLLNQEGSFVKNQSGNFVSDGNYIVKGFYWTTNKTGQINEILRPYCGTVPFNEETYYKYTGGQPTPSPDYEQPINSIEGSVEFACRGKNLFDGVNQNYYLNNEVYRCGYAVGDSGLAINVSQYSQLTVSTQSIQERYRVGCVDSLPTGAGSSEVPVFNGVNKDGTNDSIIVDTTDYNYLIINATNLSVIQVEEGSVATEIEPYIEPNEVTFNLNDEKLRSVGDVKDELVVDLDTGDYYKLKNIEHIERAISNMGPSENFPGWDDVEKIKDYFPNANNNLKDLTSYSSNICLEGNFVIGIATINNSTLWLYQGHFNMKRKDWQENYPDLIFKLDYVIPNTETIKLGTLSAEDLAKLKTFKGYNNVTINTNLGLMNIRFTYGLDIKKYVDNKIAELSAQLIKGE
jgi:hypothetical protein